MQTKTQKQQVELFFNAGDIEEQENFIIYPKSLERNEDKWTYAEDYIELLQTVSKPFERENNNSYIWSKIEKSLKERKLYPDPTKIKATSKWFYAQIKEGAVVFRYGYDGRKESMSGRYQYTIEGGFLKGIDLKKSVSKYSQIGIDIIDLIGNAFPENIETLLIEQKNEKFMKMKEEYQKKDKLESLFNHFYVACKDEEIAIDVEIKTYPLYKTGLKNSLNFTRKRILNKIL